MIMKIPYIYIYFKFPYQILQCGTHCYIRVDIQASKHFWV